MTMMLIGNKCDLEHKRQVSTDEGEAFAAWYSWRLVRRLPTMLMTRSFKLHRLSMKRSPKGFLTSAMKALASGLALSRLLPVPAGGPVQPKLVVAVAFRV